MATGRGLGLFVVALAALGAQSAPAPSKQQQPVADVSAPAAVSPAVESRPVTFSEFSPLGTVKQVRQARARFETPMVALGDAQLRAPFAIDCGRTGQGRWVDAYNWVFDFDDDLPSGIRCRFSLQRGLTDLDGRPVTARGAFRFDTGGPSIVSSLPADGADDIDEQQVFMFRLDGAVSEDSVREHVYCVVDGLAEALPVTILRDGERSAVLAQRRRLGYSYYRLLWKNGAESVARVTDASMRKAEAGILVLRCARPLPPDTKVQVTWGPGVASPNGLATTVVQRIAYQVRPAFAARVECTRPNAGAGCLPMTPILVQFNAPVPRELALAVRVTSGGRTFRPAETESSATPTLESVSFAGPFAEGAPTRVLMPAELRDDSGRPLSNASRFPLELRMDPAPPLAKFSATFGILESSGGAALPVTLRNLDAPAQGGKAAIPARMLRVEADPRAIVSWLDRVDVAMAPSGNWVEEANGNDRHWRETTGSISVFKEGDNPTDFQIPKPAGAQAFEVVGIPLPKTGLYVVELASRRLGESLLGSGQTRYVATAALVTNLAVHFKWGRESSLVWVTRLDNGKPVPNATVEIASACSGEVRWSGRTGRDGVAIVPESFGKPTPYSSCRGWASPLIALARVAGDFSFVITSWDAGISSSSFGFRGQYGSGEELYHTVFDRPLFRPGETVSMKHYLRRHVSTGIAVDGNLSRTRRVKISHQGSDQRYEFDIAFDSAGIATQQWAIPTGAARGTYVVEISDPDAEGRMLQTGSFKVEEFRVPTMRARVSGPARPLPLPRSVPVDVQVSYLSGGGAAGLPVTLRTYVEPAPLEFEGYGEYRFGGEAPQTGIRPEGDTSDEYDEEGLDGEFTNAGIQVKAQALTLGAGGAARIDVQAPARLDSAAVLTAELEYPDSNGELLTAVGRVRLSPSAMAVGIRQDGSIGQPDKLRFQVVVLDLDGRPLPGRAVQVDLYSSKSYWYRRRLVGGFYAYESTSEVERLAAGCSGSTDARGLLHCDVAPGIKGEVILRAEARDDARRIAGATSSAWIAGADDWWFDGGSSNRMTVTADKKEYQAGDTARLQVRMPFRKATALVTVEREGVLRGFVTSLDGRTPTVDVPVEAADAPNVYVSVLAVRGRVPHPDDPRVKPADGVTALVDLNKPAFRLGVAAVRVDWKPNRLDVSVRPGRDVYGVRETADVDVRVRRADGGALPPGTELAFAAVDAGLLELAPNASWDLLKAMMGERGLEVETYSAQSQIVGKRHHGRKAVPHGGGGGRSRARQSFDTLLTWQARVKVGADGTARLRVPVNDSLTTFHLVAIANGGAKYFGTGSADITTSQDIILMSGLPPMVRQGDSYLATFTVRNTTDKPQRVTIDATVRPARARGLPSRVIDLAPGEARDAWWEVAAPDADSEQSWDVAVRYGSGKVADRLTVSQLVTPRVEVSTQQATLAQVDRSWRLTVARPALAEPGRGGVDVAMQATLGDGLDGVRDFMRSYPFDCIEQQVSAAVVLGEPERWDWVMRRLPAYMDRAGLLRYFPTAALPGDDVLTAYVLTIADASARRIPDASQEAMIRGLEGFLTGRYPRDSALPTSDLAMRRLGAIAALARYGRANPGMLDAIDIEPNRWPTSGVLDWLDILTRVDGIPLAKQRADEARRILRSRLTFGGASIGFSTERTDALWWLMSSTDGNAARILVAAIEVPSWSTDAPMLARGLLGRQVRGHWNTTVANAWATVALARFSSQFESTPVTGASTVELGGQTRTVKWPASERDGTVELPWPPGPSALAVRHVGSGKPWVLVRTRAAVPVTKSFGAGFKVRRTLSAVERARPDAWTRGDIVRVRLDLETQSDQTWVAVVDPVPAGATLLGSGLGGQSNASTRGETRRGYAWLAYTERRQGEFRAFYRYVPKGKWRFEYTMRLDNPGTFGLPPTRVEAMYAPEWYAVAPNSDLVIGRR